jgi:uncharacterized Zn-binding protein involved in type VI secretion
MPGIARIGDTVTTNHICTSSTTVIKAAARDDTVFIDNIAVALLNDKTPVHSYASAGRGSCNVSHEVVFSNGSSTVFANGKAVLRKNDTIGGEEITGGSSSVFAG